MLALNELYKAISKQENAPPEATLLVAGDFNAWKRNPFYHIFSSMLHVQPEENKTFTPQTETRTKLSLFLDLSNLTITLSS